MKKQYLVSLAALAAASAMASPGRTGSDCIKFFGTNDAGHTGMRHCNIASDINMSALGGGMSNVGNDTYFGGNTVKMGAGDVSAGLAKHFGKRHDGAHGSLATYTGAAVIGAS